MTTAYINPFVKNDCPHVEGHINAPIESLNIENNVCGACQDTSESWICLMCGAANCSRYVC